MVLTILTICSGNICRSPMAEQLLRVGLVNVPGVAVHSAGTVGMAGNPMDERAARLAVEHGSLDAESHVARVMSAEMLREAGLILAMAREHRKAVVEQFPRAVRKTFTIREFARISSALSDDDLRGLATPPEDDLRARFSAAVDLVADERGMLPPVEPADDDVVDPYRRSDDVFLASAEQIVPAVQAVVGYFGRVATVVAT